MKVLYTDDSQASSCLVYPASFKLTQNQAYVLSFSAVSNKAGTVQAIVRQAHAPWSTIGLSKSFILSTVRKDFAALFIASATDTQSRIDLYNTKTDSLYWIDNVSLLPVQVEAEDPQEKSKLFYNATIQQQLVSLGGRTYRTLDNNPVTGSIALGPFESVILIADTWSTGNPRKHITRGNAGVYNPTMTFRRGTLYLSLFVLKKSALSVRLFDVLGRTVFRIDKKVCTEGINTIAVEKKLVPGRYVLQITGVNGVYSKGWGLVY